MEDILQYVLGFSALGLLWTATDPMRTRRISLIDTVFRRDKTHTSSILVGIMLIQLVTAIYIPVFPYTEPVAITASAVFWFGFFLAVWGKLSMKSFWSTPAQHDIKRQHVLITNGPFQYTRNPIYVGLILMSVSASIGVFSIAAPLTLIFVQHVRYIVRVEEQILTRHFGKKYREYCHHIPRFL